MSPTAGEAERLSYLTASDWPEAIEQADTDTDTAPEPFAEKSHDDPFDVDRYPASHPDAASVGDVYLGDVCPWCGTPIRCDMTVVNSEGETGHMMDVSPNDDPIPCYHPLCWWRRKKKLRPIAHRTLDEFS